MISNPAKSTFCSRLNAFVRLAILLTILQSLGTAFGQQGSPMGHDRPLPDPRFRTVIGLNELQNLVNLLVAKNGLQVRVTVVEDGSGSVAVARVTGVALSGLIEVNPQAARSIPPNTWALILGHDLSHLVDTRAQHGPGKDFKTLEWNADLIGAEYALRAGFDLAAHVGWVLSRPDRWSPEYGGDHERALRIAHQYRVDWGAVQICRARYGQSARRAGWR